jgi:hypothetical protein
MRDLFAGPPPSPEQLALLRAAQEARERASRAQRKARLAALAHLEKWQAVVNILGAKLAHSPDLEHLANLFHGACERLHAAEVAVDEHYPVRRVSARQELEIEQPD